MAVRCKCIIYQKNKLRFGPFVNQKVKKVYFAGSVTTIRDPKIRFYKQKKSESKNLNNSLNRNLRNN